MFFTPIPEELRPESGKPQISHSTLSMAIGVPGVYEKIPPSVHMTEKSWIMTPSYSAAVDALQAPESHAGTDNEHVPLPARSLAHRE